jgi:hypothetical protein
MEKFIDFVAVCYGLWAWLLGPLYMVFVDDELWVWLSIAPMTVCFFLAAVFQGIRDFGKSRGLGSEPHWAGGCDGGE